MSLTKLTTNTSRKIVIVKGKMLLAHLPAAAWVVFQKYSIPNSMTWYRPEGTRLPLRAKGVTTKKAMKNRTTVASNTENIVLVNGMPLANRTPGGSRYQPGQACSAGSATVGATGFQMPPQNPPTLKAIRPPRIISPSQIQRQNPIRRGCADTACVVKVV